jgi:hypothetical protein
LKKQKKGPLSLQVRKQRKPISACLLSEREIESTHVRTNVSTVAFNKQKYVLDLHFQKKKKQISAFENRKEKTPGPRCPSWPKLAKRIDLSTFAFGNRKGRSPPSRHVRKKGTLRRNFSGVIRE